MQMKLFGIGVVRQSTIFRTKELQPDFFHFLFYLTMSVTKILTNDIFWEVGTKSLDEF